MIDALNANAKVEPHPMLPCLLTRNSVASKLEMALPQNWTSIVLLLFPAICIILWTLYCKCEWLTVISAAADDDDDVLAVKTLEFGPITTDEYTRDFVLGLSSLIYKCKVTFKLQLKQDLMHACHVSKDLTCHGLTFCTTVVFIVASNDNVVVGLYWGKFLYR